MHQKLALGLFPVPSVWRFNNFAVLLFTLHEHKTKDMQVCNSIYVAILFMEFLFSKVMVYFLRSSLYIDKGIYC